jgi:hypothetical protein
MATKMVAARAPPKTSGHVQADGCDPHLVNIEGLGLLDRGFPD